ncbi:MAG: HAD family hydrolase [Thermohalobaculum sp.]|nr:HAD family hydrolase [Thermohalobaculum sp.]
MPCTIRIAMWSGPRNISTAMMRAWENRADTAVMDEPFYGAYLRDTGLDHPMRAEVMAHHATDWDAIAGACATAAGAPIVYQKHMCQHMIPGAPRDWMGKVRHAFLIRPPQAVAASFRRGWDGMGVEDLGYRQQAELFDHVCQLTGMAPPVIEARDVLERPEAMLPALCGALGVAFDPAMLAWPAGRRDSDGVWGAHWYRTVEASTGFVGYREPGPVPSGLERVVDACMPFYDAMRAWRLGPVEAGE